MSKLTPSALSFSELILEVFHLNGLALAAGEVLSNPSGLTSARWQVLGVVDHGPVPVASVARTMGLARQSVQLTADSLERDGFIEYVDNPHHRRARLIAITDAGRKALRGVEARQATWANRLGERLEPATLRATLEGLRRVRELLEQDAVTLEPHKE
ncbi:MarR family winged helix-turn-helix transcriptional regulator [Melittangium boletus]|uniref:MarR family transcriptional regulator n=1 Tax=Melittangium boletus DSM 14713 TaxID=1294270 RepID=A0A250IKL9_9BACT|nr:MarR family winged helix-turn-helix transcriptional regulator [Melittangium boletus]ATB31782.1 MarR family transcriptional regulator [Melittangium boletus DSM 14713]